MVNHKRVERIWRQEGLKVPKKQPRRGRLFTGSSDLYTTVEHETLIDGIYMATWTMSGSFNGAPFTAPGMSIVKFVDGTVESDYSRDYYTEGDVMLGVPELVPAVTGLRTYTRCAVDPPCVCPFSGTRTYWTRNEE